jgi:hypothetical protein
MKARKSRDVDIVPVFVDIFAEHQLNSMKVNP